MQISKISNILHASFMNSQSPTQDKNSQPNFQLIIDILYNKIWRREYLNQANLATFSEATPPILIQRKETDHFWPFTSPRSHKISTRNLRKLALA